MSQYVYDVSLTHQIKTNKRSYALRFFKTEHSNRFKRRISHRFLYRSIDVDMVTILKPLKNLQKNE